MKNDGEMKLFRILKGIKKDNLKDVKEIEKKIKLNGVNLLSINELKEALTKEFNSWRIYNELEIQQGINSILESNLGCMRAQTLGENHFSKGEPKFEERLRKWIKIPLHNLLVLRINDRYFFKTVREDSNPLEELEICLSLLKIIDEVEMDYSNKISCIAEFNNYLNAVERFDEYGQMKSYLEDKREEIMKGENNPSVVKYYLLTELRKALSTPEVDDTAMNVLEKPDGTLSDIWSDFLNKDYVDRTFIYHPNYSKVVDIVTSILYLKSYDKIELNDTEYYEICYSMFVALYYMNKHDTAILFGEKLIEANYLKETRYGHGAIFVYRVRPYSEHGTKRDFLYRKMVELYTERGLYNKAKKIFFKQYKPYYAKLLESQEFWDNLDLLFQYESQCFVQINEHEVGDFRYSEQNFAVILKSIERSYKTKHCIDDYWEPKSLSTGEPKDYKEVRVFIEKVILILVNDNNFIYASNLLSVYSKYFDYSETFINQLSPTIKRRIHNEFESKLSSIWDKLNDTSKNNIMLAEFLYFEIKNNGSSTDYSAPALCLGKALEFELKKRWAIPAEKASFEEDGEIINKNGFKKRVRLTERNIEAMNIYTLGCYSFSYKLRANEDGTNVDKIGFFKNKILSFYDDTKLTEAKLDRIFSDNGPLDTVTNIRNNSAHSSNTVTENDLLGIIEILINREDSLFITVFDGYKEELI